MFLHVLKATASNGSKNKKWYFFGRKLWSGLVPPHPKVPFFDAAPNFNIAKASRVNGKSFEIDQDAQDDRKSSNTSDNAAVFCCRRVEPTEGKWGKKFK